MTAWQQVGYSASLSSPTWSTRPTTGCRAGLTPLWVHRNLFWQLSRDGNLHGSGMSHAMTASPKLFFRASWRVGDDIHGQQRKCLMDDFKEWTFLPMPELLTRASCWKDWRRVSAELSLMFPRWPNRSRDLTELNYHYWTELSLITIDYKEKGRLRNFLLQIVLPPRSYFFMQTLPFFFWVGGWGRIWDFMLKIV